MRCTTYQGWLQDMWTPQSQAPCVCILRDTVRFSARCKTNHTYSDRYFGVALAVSMNDPRTIGISRFVPRLTPSSRKTLIWEQRDQTVTVQRPTPFQRLNASTPQPTSVEVAVTLLCPPTFGT